MERDSLFWVLGFFLLSFGLSGQAAYWLTPKHSRRYVRGAGLFTGAILLWTVFILGLEVVA